MLWTCVPGGKAIVGPPTNVVREFEKISDKLTEEYFFSPGYHLRIVPISGLRVQIVKVAACDTDPGRRTARL